MRCRASRFGARSASAGAAGLRPLTFAASPDGLAKHIAAEERMLVPPAEKTHASFSPIGWLEKEMKRLHDALG
ncbi:MscS Mechanosensitive ion channel [Burkholderia sp. KJ006]|nr:MscS Mechanosensitive ion channel [Burkholderia sp. KJ006]